jgi:hypothetical protein
MRNALVLCLWTLLLLPAVQAQEAPAPTASTEQPSIRFLTRAQGSAALTAPEDGYYARLQLGEMRAKTGQPLQGMTLKAAREQVRQAYGAEVEEFTADERTALRDAVTELQPALRTKAPLYARTPWSFIKVSAKIEGGLPHTRGGYIVLSDGLLTDIVRQHSRSPLTAPVGLRNLLVHEQTHVLQRQHTELFTDLYTQSFGFRHVVLGPMPQWLLERSIVNLDAPDADWVFPIGDGAARHWIIPYLVLRNLDHPRMPDDFDVVALDVDEGVDAWAFADRNMPAAFSELDSLTAYMRAFPDQNELFHPNEISAGLLAAILSGSQIPHPEHPLWSQTRAWAERSLR